MQTKQACSVKMGCVRKHTLCLFEMFDCWRLGTELQVGTVLEGYKTRAICLEIRKYVMLV